MNNIGAWRMMCEGRFNSSQSKQEQQKIVLDILSKICKVMNYRIEVEPASYDAYSRKKFNESWSFYNPKSSKVWQVDLQTLETYFIYKKESIFDDYILMALKARYAGMIRPYVDVDMLGKHALNAMICLWAVGYDLNNIVVKEKFLHYKRQVAEYVSTVSMITESPA